MMPQKPNCLVVDDEKDIGELIVFTLERMGIHAESADNLDDAKFMLRQRKYDLCLTDMRLPDGNGLDLVHYVGQHQPGLPIAVITAFGSAENAVSALKAGAFDYITKPISLQQLRPLVQAALKLSHPQEATDNTLALLGVSPAITETRHTIEKLASNQAPVFISGESGSGKELAARLIHLNSPRRNGAFVKVNCGSIPEKLIDGELFGYKKNAQNSTDQEHKGFLLAANGGTIFLDEIADLPLTIQTKLLQVIQDKKLHTAGSEKEESIDIRIISATHRNMPAMMEHGLFRKDLYYRLNVIPLTMPALREMPADIPLLAQNILENLCQSQDREVPELNEEAIKRLIAHDFPGNVRELENVLQRALAMCENNTIVPEDLLMQSEPKTQAMNVDATGLALPDYLENIEKQAILSALEKTRQNKTAAAKLLGVSFRTLRYRLSKLGLSKDKDVLDDE